MEKRKKKRGLFFWSQMAFIVAALVIAGIVVTENFLAKRDAQQVQKVEIPETLVAEASKQDFKQADLVDRPSIKNLREFQNSNAYQKILKKTAGVIEIPSLNLQLPIFLGTTDQNLKVGATTFREDQELGEGNYVLLGHNMGVAGILFSDLNQLELNDEIQVTVAKKDGVTKKRKLQSDK
ncbi:sortase family protein [Listeria floridensis FSL S10-1187]|uniref:Sortase family protein n=1 Tax=Listeria floridensis FSL S10-1187 TaxID=1265817 RepID=A0ABN0RGS9_9LIST|nr:sortase [Listeria floridensis]EUJ33140.1 sortase family protein [Listeria floridensis FSL S10-1187]